MSEPTPVRQLGEINEHGCRVLSDPGIGYADGAEERLAEIVGGATDLSSSSEELASAATDWGTTYSLVPTRSNLLRSLDLRPGMKVLEIGCGCGPITRYLGEQCGTVDSVEPMPARARVARLRTRDLDSVEVFVGTLDDVPAEPVYDVVVVVGVLEYVGGGTADPAPYLRFLEQCHAVLKDGGTLALAIENPLGVKYVAGAVEDHTNRPFDSLEGYMLASPARTFTRRTLQDMLATAGFGSEVLSAFPDYKLPRAVFTDDLVHRSPELAAHLPRFPSPDYLVPRLNLADEAQTWRTLVDSGVGQHFANSFLALATKGEGPRLWPAERLALLFSTERRRPYAVRGEVRGDGDGLVFLREVMHPGAAQPDGAADVRHTPAASERVVPGAELLTALVEQPERRGELLRAWIALLPADDLEWMPVDLVPHNVVVDDDGTLVAIDQEWQVRGYGRSSTIVRGLFLAALQIAQLTRPQAASPWVTVGDVVRGLASEAGVELDDAAVDAFVASESAFQSTVVSLTGPDAPSRDRSARDLRSMWDETLSAVRGGERFDLQWAEATAQLSAHDDEVAALRDEIAGLQDDVARRDESVAAERARALAAEQRVEHLTRRTAYGLLVRLRRRLARGRAGGRPAA
ncbi:SAM-dependent methyltransferase [Cellulomonas sp. FA1]|uniref:SAM-dependent methyltransferase n=1 Tax=Cellulomonas sp. FA1 TaxID=1346710 RepID=UPI00062581F0|nr:methyltransferase [Cellulomonas sp. FA1]